MIVVFVDGVGGGALCWYVLTTYGILRGDGNWGGGGAGSRKWKVQGEWVAGRNVADVGGVLGV